MVKDGVPLSLIRRPPEVMEITRIRELRAEDESAIAELRDRLDKALDTVAAERSAAGKGRTGP